MPAHIDLSYENPSPASSASDADDHETFSHPYEPYNIQIRFMKELYDTLQNKKVGIFESPTGTVSSATSFKRFVADWF